MTDTFTWRVHSTASGGGDLNVSESSYGDGYKQTLAIGINPDVQTWSVTIEGTREEMQAAVDFIRDHAGLAFFWTPPLGDQGYYTCKKYQPRLQGGGLWTVQLEFEQGYKP